jgi:hypothetical protein
MRLTPERCKGDRGVLADSSLDDRPNHVGFIQVDAPRTRVSQLPSIPLWTCSYITTVEGQFILVLPLAIDSLTTDLNMSYSDA